MKNFLQLIYTLVVIFGLLVSEVTAASCRIDNSGSNFSPTLDFAKRLGWVISSEPDNLCGGYYVEPSLAAFGQPTLPLDQSKTSITFTSADISQRKMSVFSGHVVVIQSGRQLMADKALAYRDPDTGKIITIDLLGNIAVYEPGRLLLGEKAHLNFNEKTGVIDNVTYRILLARDEQVAEVEEALANNKVRLHGTTAWGRAKKVIQHGPGIIELRNATYSTCAPTVEQWRLLAANISINKQTGRGVARDVKLTVHGTPVFYSPYLTFPTNERQRKTGFLFPTINTSSTSGTSGVQGFFFSFPFYWNLAPNYDLTIVPRFYTNRGVLFDNLFRYLTPKSNGNVKATFLPGDKAFERFKTTAAYNYPGQFGLESLMHDGDNRALFSWQNESLLNEHWTSTVDYTYVSDDYYFQDFGSIPSIISTNQLLRQADINYHGENWNFSALLESYETLHPVNRQPINNLYSRLPELDLNADYPNFFHDFDFAITNQIVFFTSPRGPLDLTTPPRGGRLNVQPALSLPIYIPAGFIVPTLQLQETNYNIQNQMLYQPNQINRTLPIFNIDSGLYFDRDVVLANVPYQQTLEPRLFYLYVPYKNQNSIPVFDSAVIPFTYNQLFATNRFSGYDRLGDANQVSLALSTRIMDQETGNEHFHAGIGEIYYFKNRRVTICNIPGCTDYYTGLGATSDTETVSPLTAWLSYYILPGWSVNGDVAWDLSKGQADTANFYFQYNPSPHILFNFGYNFLRNGDIIQNLPVFSSQNNLSQASASFTLPITTEWSTVGLSNYDFGQNHVQSYLLGVQYDSCCWAFRVLGGRTFTALNQNGSPMYSTSINVQWVLKGLANIDPNSVGTKLAEQIPGYQDPFADKSGIQMLR